MEHTLSRRNDSIKVIAMLTMLIDHIGLMFFPNQAMWRLIGRIAFPIFAYALAMGFYHTSDRKRYLLRLTLFALIAQLPYMYLNVEAELNVFKINQIAQLIYALLVLYLFEKGQKANHLLSKILFISLSIGVAFVPDMVRFYEPRITFGYGTYGILMSLIFWVFRGKWLHITIAYILLSLFYPYHYALTAVNAGERGYVQAFFNLAENFTMFKRYGSPLSFSGVWLQSNSILALPILYLGENVSTDWKLNKWVTYWFYPVHMAILVVLHHLL